MRFFPAIQCFIRFLIYKYSYIWLYSESTSNFQHNGLFTFCENELRFFPKVPWVIEVEKFFSPISLESISFDVESDRRERYEVIFVFF